MIRRLLTAVVRGLRPPRVIQDGTGEIPYLSRWYLRGRPWMADGSDPFDHFGNPKPEAIWPKGIGVYLHRFHRSDVDRELHSHPWAWSYSIILAGGYIEERRMPRECRCGHAQGDHRNRNGRWTVTACAGLCNRCDCGEFKSKVVRRSVRPGMLNVIRGDDFHRVDLIEADAWTLFVVGPKTGSSWGFWDRETGAVTPWREFLAKTQRADDPEWERLPDGSTRAL